MLSTTCIKPHISVSVPQCLCPRCDPSLRPHYMSTRIKTVTFHPQVLLHVCQRHRQCFRQVLKIRHFQRHHNGFIDANTLCVSRKHSFSLSFTLSHMHFLTLQNKTPTLYIYKRIKVHKRQLLLAIKNLFSLKNIFILHGNLPKLCIYPLGIK